MSRTCISLDVFRRCAHLPDTIHTALAHGTTAHTACEKYSAGVEPLAPLATAVRSSVSQQHPGCTEHGCCDPLRVGRPSVHEAHFQQRPAASPCCPKSTGSFITWMTACGRRVASVGNILWRRGGRWTLPLKPPALSRSRSRCRGTANGLPADLGRFVETRALCPVARCTQCVQWPRSRSAHAHYLLRSGALADGRISAIASLRQSSFRNSA